VPLVPVRADVRSFADLDVLAADVKAKSLAVFDILLAGIDTFASWELGR